MRHVPRLLALGAVVLGLMAWPHSLVSHIALGPDFVHFESGHVHPEAITPDGTRLLVVNTPDNRLSVFDITGAFPVRIAEIPVGLEPVSVAARNDGEAWVVNNLSDDVSVVDLTRFHVRASLRVGDEPNDVVFAGSAGRAYVSVSQEDAVKVYDPAALSTPPIVIPIPGRMPRSLARNLDGSQVLVDILDSSGGATSLSAAEAGDSLPAPSPPMNPDLPPRPKTGLLVRFDGSDWRDTAGHLWNSKIPYSVPRVEVVYLDAGTNTVLGSRRDIATSVLSVATSPVTGAAAVTGTFARLDTQLEPNLRGHFTEQRLAIVPNLASPHTEVQLNPHVVYDVLPAPQSERDSSIGMPTGVCWSADGQRVYVSSLATNKLAVLSAGGALLARIPTLAGPTGVLADPARPRLYVVGRFHEQLQMLSTADLASLSVTPIGFDPTPDEIVNGRKFFYGGFTSGHGDQACASCHLFGDFDNLVWELGNPLGSMSPPPQNQIDPQLAPSHPMKGPMATQSLRGLLDTGVLHWRGDRADVAAFNAAFVSLMGLAAPLADSEMTALTAFILPLVYPPNPNENLDRTPPDAPAGQPSALRGRDFFMNTTVDGSARCVDCHGPPAGTTGEVLNRNLLRESQDMKIPHLRNLYKKSGFRDSAGAVNKRGFGYTHDGSVDNLFDFLHSDKFDFGSPPQVADASRRDVERFLLAFDTGMPPMVGCQVTFDGANNAGPALARLDTLESQAAAGEGELVAHGRVGSTPHGWLYSGGSWTPDRSGSPAITRAQLLALAAPGHELTVTGVPPGCGRRMALDRDRDGFLDGDELAAGTDPGDPASHPVLAVAPIAPPGEGLRELRPSPFRSSTRIAFALARTAPVTLALYDLQGRQVRSLARGEPMSAGTHVFAWDGRDAEGRSVSAGVYFVRMSIPSRSWQRMVIRIP